MTDSSAHDKALAWFDGQPPGDGNFLALALDALIDGLGCTWAVAVAVAVDTGDGPALLSSRCKDGESPYKPGDERIAPPFQADPADRYWFVSDIPADQGVEFTSCHGHILHDGAGNTIGYVLAMDRRTMADDSAAAMFFRLIAERISNHLAHSVDLTGPARAKFNNGEKKQTEAELHTSERRLQDFADASVDWFWETNAAHEYTYLSDGFERATGFPPERLYGVDRHRLLGAAATTPADFEMLRKLQAHLAVRDHIHQFPIEGREAMWIRTSSLPIHDNQGNFIGYRGSTANITAEVEARAQLQSVADRYLDAIDSMSDGVALWDEDDRLVICNRRFKELSAEDIGILQPDMKFEDFLRKCAEGASFHEEGALLETAIQERLHAHQNPPSETEIRRISRALSIRERRTPDGGTITIAVDMSQQRQFEAVGQLTGGIAHDFNNLLAVISGNLELLDQRAKNNPDLTRFIERGLAAAERGAQLTNRLLAFSRQQPLAAKSVTMDRLIDGMQDLVQRTLGETIRIKTTTAADPWPCLVDVSQMENAILNLAINARDAMPDGGDLTIETDNLDLTDGSAAQRLNLKPGCYVTLSVRDTGTGMEAAVIERAFDPFFTTKDGDKGSGLGLSMVYGFVRQSGGQTRIDSIVGEGTTVTIFLLRNIDGEVDGSQSVETPDTIAGHGEMVLVVEDDGEVREIAVAMLREFGYRVLHVTQGEEAIALMENTPDLNLLLSDVMLPGGISGKALAEAARAIIPDLRVLFMSGYTRDAFGANGRPDPGDDLLEKPFRKSELAEAVRRTLNSG